MIRLQLVLNNKWMKRSIFITLIIFLFYMGFVNFTEPTQIGIARNQITGEMWMQKGGGVYFTPPWVWVARIDIRPLRVSITTAGRGYNSKLVEFQPEAWREFVQVEGWHYYWWYNRFSINFGYDEEYRGLRDILRGHAYGAKKYSFLKVLQEYQQDQ